jgi:transcriptional regulator with XRE-family HTH domain
MTHIQIMKDNNIKQLRKLIKERMSINTQTEAAKRIGISQSYLSMILNGKRTPKNTNEILKKLNSMWSLKFSKN